MTPHYERALLLFNRERFEEAVRELQQAIAESEDDMFAHGLLALSLSQLDRHQQALEAARRAVEISPDSDYGHFVLARVRLAAAHPDAVVPMVLFHAVVWTFMILIVVAQPLFGLVLRLNRDGRRALSPDQIRASNWHAVCLVAALAMGLLFAWKGDRQMRLLAIATVMLTFAITNTFDATPGWVRNRMKLITTLAAALIPLSFALRIVALFLLVKRKINTVWLVKVALLYLPMISVILSGFSDNFATFLEKRRPDATAPV